MSVAVALDPHRLLGMLRHLEREMKSRRWGRIHVPRDDDTGAFDSFTLSDVEAELARLRGETNV